MLLPTAKGLKEKTTQKLCRGINIAKCQSVTPILLYPRLPPDVSKSNWSAAIVWRRDCGDTASVALPVVVEAEGVVLFREKGEVGMPHMKSSLELG
jgi:hypothetical protein